MNLSLPYLGHHEGDLRTEVNPGKGNPWAKIHLTETRGVSLQWLNEGDCDRLIKAAAAAKQQILDARAHAAAPHKAWMSIPDTGCLHCGKPKDDELHAEPAPCPSVAEHSGRPCTETGEHVKHRNGTVVWGPGVTEPASPEVAEQLYDAVFAGMPVIVADDEPAGCPASTDLDDDEVVFCDKPAGHAGNHHAAVSDVSGGFEVAWPNPCGARPYPAGSEGDDGTECTLPVGHEGAHDDEPASVTA